MSMTEFQVIYLKSITRDVDWKLTNSLNVKSEFLLLDIADVLYHVFYQSLSCSGMHTGASCMCS